MTVGGQKAMRWKCDGMRLARGRSGGAHVRRSGPSRLRSGWQAILLAVLLAFSWQSFVVQTHQHLNTGAFSGAANAQADANKQRPGRQSPGDLPSCSICREISHAGTYLLPAPIDFEAPVPVTFWLGTALLSGLALASRSHAWQSRAPPHPLQA